MEQRRGDDGARNLRDHIRRDLGGGKTAARGETDRNGWIEVAAGYVPDRIGHGHDAQPEGQGHADKADPDLRKTGGDDRAAASSKCEPKRSDQFSRIFTCFHGSTSRNRSAPADKSSQKAANSGTQASLFVI